MFLMLIDLAFQVCFIERKSTNHNIALYTGGCKNKNVSIEIKWT